MGMSGSGEALGATTISLHVGKLVNLSNSE